MICPISIALLDGISWRDSAIVGGDSCQVLKHRPQLPKHLGFLCDTMAAAQDAIHCCGRSSYAGGIPGTCRIGEEHHAYEACWHLHNAGMYARNLLGDLLPFDLGRKKVLREFSVAMRESA